MADEAPLVDAAYIDRIKKNKDALKAQQDQGQLQSGIVDALQDNQNPMAQLSGDLQKQREQSRQRSEKTKAPRDAYRKQLEQIVAKSRGG